MGCCCYLRIQIRIRSSTICTVRQKSLLILVRLNAAWLALVLLRYVVCLVWNWGKLLA